jgi:hypothetical protein
MTKKRTQPGDEAPRRKTLLETSAIIVGYAMSRLDEGYLKAMRAGNWKAAFAAAGSALGVTPASLKNLRDEFDPVHPNPRRGWVGRPMRKERQRVMGELCDLSDEALLELIQRVLARDADAADEVIAPLSRPSSRVSNVAERLRTGRLAEEHFLAHSQAIVRVLPSLLLDHRTLARGYDFGVQGREEVAIEVKGLKQRRGGIAFTDREWTEAKARRDNFWLVVVGNLEVEPIAKVIHDPVATLQASCTHQATITASWRATVAVA